MAKMEGAKAVSLAFRIIALVLSVAAAVVMGTASQLIIVSGWGRVVSYSNYSTLVYFVVGSVMSVVGGVLALYLFVHRGGGSLTISLIDTAAQAILFSASGAALASRHCFLDGADTFLGRTGTAVAIGVCVAAAVSIAALMTDAPRGGFSIASRAGGGDADGGSACKHG